MNTKEAIKTANRFKGHEPKIERSGKSGGTRRFNDQIANALLTADGINATEAGKLLHGDQYDKDLDGSSTRDTIRKTQKSLARDKGYIAVKVVSGQKKRYYVVKDEQDFNDLKSVLSPSQSIERL